MLYFRFYKNYLMNKLFQLFVLCLLIWSCNSPKQEEQQVTEEETVITDTPSVKEKRVIHDLPPADLSKDFFEMPVDTMEGYTWSDDGVFRMHIWDDVWGEILLYTIPKMNRKLWEKSLLEKFNGDFYQLHDSLEHTYNNTPLKELNKYYDMVFFYVDRKHLEPVELDDPYNYREGGYLYFISIINGQTEVVDSLHLAGENLYNQNEWREVLKQKYFDRYKDVDSL